MSNASELVPERLAAETLRFARDRLGPASEGLLADPAVQVLVISRVRNGFDLEDAVLAEVHRATVASGRIADEFLAYFLTDLMRVGHRLRSSALRRFLDTGDLVQSVVGDLWPELQSVRFETRGRFLSYLSRRLRWKAVDRSRALEADKRREDQRTEADAADLELDAESDSPHAAVEEEEDRSRLALVLLRLSERDRGILALFLKDFPLPEIAAQVGLSYDAARMALHRAIRRARRLL